MPVPDDDVTVSAAVAAVFPNVVAAVFPIIFTIIDIDFKVSKLKLRMWILGSSRPEAITVRAVIKSVHPGTQENSYRLRIKSEKGEPVWVAIAFPWAPHKSNGGFQDTSVNLLPADIDNNPSVEDIKDAPTYSRLRDLKTKEGIELMYVQELINWYLDDVGVVTFWADSEKWYQLNYRHKIASDSCLFFPTRLPVTLSYRKPEMDYKLWVVDGLTMTIPKQLVRESREGVTEVFTFKSEGWGWDEDTRINTDNWESSDDELED